MGEEIAAMDFRGQVIELQMVRNRQFAYSPKEDITAYELALCMPMIVTASSPYGDAGMAYDALPEIAKRHWSELGQ